MGKYTTRRIPLFEKEGGGEILDKDDWMTEKKLSVIGKPLRKIDAMAKCAGETIFADDLNLPRTIYAKLLRSPHLHARVLSVNAARALELDGVFAVIMG